MSPEDITDTYDGYIYHYYRAEIYRETNWRNRLDVTTNWAIVVTAAMLSYVFGNEHAPHAVIVMNYLVVLFFLYTESRRFRYYMMLKERTRIIEKEILSRIIGGGKKRSGKQLRVLEASLIKPHIDMSKIESIGWRVRRNYVFLICFLYATWIVRLSYMANGPISFSKILTNARMWIVPGPIIFTLFTASVISFVIMGLYLPRRSVGDDLP